MRILCFIEDFSFEQEVEVTFLKRKKSLLPAFPPQALLPHRLSNELHTAQKVHRASLLVY